VVERTLALRAELVVVTGDLVDGRVGELGPALAPLARLAAPLGVFVVTGNHEYYWDAPAWVLEYERLGLAVLCDEHRVLRRGAATMVLAGVPDLQAAEFVPEHRSDPAAALLGAPPADLRLLLAHQPRSLDAAVAAGYDLQLSGHTHGGQLFPWTLLIHLAQPVVRGLARFGRTWVYVNRGTGTWGPPLRSNGPGEITLVVLERA
jgi:predicted MPP superfamily phosphohydrolase